MQLKIPMRRFVDTEPIELNNQMWDIRALSPDESILVDGIGDPIVPSSKVIFIYPGEQLFVVIHHESSLKKILLKYSNFVGKNFGKLVKTFPVKFLQFDEYIYPIISATKTQADGWVLGDMFWNQLNVESFKGYYPLSKNNIEVFAHDKNGNIWTLYNIVMKEERANAFIALLKDNDIPDRIVIDKDFLDRYSSAGEESC